MGRGDHTALPPAGPSFVKPFRLLYNFEKLQALRLLVVDIDKGHDAAKVDPARCVRVLCWCAMGQVAWGMVDCICLAVSLVPAALHTPGCGPTGRQALCYTPARSGNSRAQLYLVACSP